MSLDTYANLQTAIANFAHRSDLTAVLPDLITLAEVRINGDLDARLQDIKTALSTVANTESVSLPTDVIDIRHLSVSSTTPIQVLVYQVPDSFEVAHTWGETGTPRAYTVIGSLLYLAPVPDSVYTLDLVYKGRFPSLSSTNTTNYLLTNYPKVYLTAAMCEVAIYIKSPVLAQLWEPQYKAAIDAVNSQDWATSSTMRVKTDVRA